MLSKDRNYHEHMKNRWHGFLFNLKWHLESSDWLETFRTCSDSVLEKLANRYSVNLIAIA